MNEYTKINIRVDKKQLEAIKALAKAKKWPYNLLIRTILDEYITKQAK